jgi:hypothetical protein
MKILKILLLIACPIGSLLAQQAIPGSYPNNLKINYVRTWDVKKPETNSFLVPTLDVPAVQETHYLFGWSWKSYTTIGKKSFIGNGHASKGFGYRDNF